MKQLPKSVMKYVIKETGVDYAFIRAVRFQQGTLTWAHPKSR